MKTMMIIFGLVTLMSIGANAQKKSSIVSESRSSKPFHHIRINGELMVKLIQDENTRVVVEGNEYQIKNTVTMLKEDTLYIYLTNVRKIDDPVKVIVYSENVQLMDINDKTDNGFSLMKSQQRGSSN